MMTEKKVAGNSVYDEIAGFQVKECLFLLSLSSVAENTLLLFPQLRIHAKRYMLSLSETERLKYITLEKLDSKDIYTILCQTLPEQNDFFVTDYSEELEELFDFGIETKIALLDLIGKHRENLLQIDSEDLDDSHISYYISELGEDYVNLRVKNKFWFSYSALLRIILELEFEEEYTKYANLRDGI